MNPKEKRTPLLIRLINRLFARKKEKGRKLYSVERVLETMQNEDEHFLFI